MTIPACAISILGQAKSKILGRILAPSYFEPTWLILDAKGPCARRLVSQRKGSMRVGVLKILIFILSCLVPGSQRDSTGTASPHGWESVGFLNLSQVLKGVGFGRKGLMLTQTLSLRACFIVLQRIEKRTASSPQGSQNEAKLSSQAAYCVHFIWVWSGVQLSSTIRPWVVGKSSVSHSGSHSFPQSTVYLWPHFGSLSMWLHP